MKTILVFVYNADSGMFNALSDIAHKIFSPQTYACNLCALTHTNFGMRGEWKHFLETLGLPVEFLHADELKTRYGIENTALPVVFEKTNEKLETLLDAAAINRCRDVAELKKLLLDKLD
ncbi:MAG: hypothetical protein M3525_11790 [Acidobacteriota bacterium]|nr:hypothetical protein [Acidobacteriota bacterium]